MDQLTQPGKARRWGWIWVVFGCFLVIWPVAAVAMAWNSAPGMVDAVTQLATPVEEAVVGLVSPVITFIAGVSLLVWLVWRGYSRERANDADPETRPELD
ncbi:MAG: hypothetical protein U0904_10135 [Candidatus Nanopelagicales bacterium]|nr:hypothetical protein [Candidatus Nanopelagicales bacterium]